MTPVLCNAGPLIVLGKLNRLDLLASLYGEVIITRAVYAEAVTAGLARGMPDARTIRLFCQATNWPMRDIPPNVLANYRSPVILDRGETEILALAQTFSAAVVLLDDETAKAEARRLGLRTWGTLGDTDASVSCSVSVTVADRVAVGRDSRAPGYLDQPSPVCTGVGVFSRALINCTIRT